MPEEFEEAELRHVKMVGLEGPAWLLGNLEEQRANFENKEIMLDALCLIEDERTLIGVSAHILAISQKV